MFRVHAEAIATVLLSHAAAKAFPHPKNEWFILHSICNAVVAASTSGTMSLLLKVDWWETPLLGIESGNVFPLCVALWMHAYHAVAFPMSADDRFHHALFLPLIGVPGLLWEWGPIGEVQLFFLCGLPGLLIYSFLVLKRYFPSLSPYEPAFSAAVNCLLRAPGALIAPLLLLRATWREEISPPRLAVAAQLLLAPANGIGYAVQSLNRALRRR